MIPVCHQLFMATLIANASRATGCLRACVAEAGVSDEPGNTVVTGSPAFAGDDEVIIYLLLHCAVFPRRRLTARQGRGVGRADGAVLGRPEVADRQLPP